MEDVIFAGTSGRPPLGRAEVLLTIDNTDGALPIEYAEVTISRTMFRSGGSEYAINGTSCRLLDVQELLSDSGIGREMHVIVGQGQLDTILHATPEDRRGFIEEAAGVLKHRKRKEKALRKLDSTEGNLHRLGDLLSEIRRQLKPLGRQAEVARRARRRCRPTCATPGPGCWPTTWSPPAPRCEQELADETVLLQRREQVEQAIAARPGSRRPRSRRPCARTCRRWPRPRTPGSRCRGCASACAAPSRWPPSGCATPRRSTEVETASGRDPDELEAEAARVREQEQRIAAEVDARRAGLEQAVTARKGAEDAAAEEERRVAALAARGRRPPRGPGPAARPGQRAALARRRGRRGGRPAAASPRGGARRAPSAPSATSPRWRPGSPASTPARRASTPSTSRRSTRLDDVEDRLAKARERGAARRPRPHDAGRPQGRPRDGPEPQGRRRRAARRRDRRRRPARLGRRAAHGAPRLRGRRRRRPRPARRRRRRRGRRRRARARSAHLKADDLGRAGLLLADGPELPGAAGWPALPAGAAYAVDVVECPTPACARRWPGCSTGSPSSTTWRRPARWSADRPDAHRGHPRRRPARRPLRRRRLQRASRA